MKLWGGRFEKETDERAAEFLHSFRFDIRLAEQDLRGSIAHARMLGRQGIIGEEESARLVEGLERIREEVRSGDPRFDPTSEDIHSAVETRLREIVGEVAGKLHTARSRNDQVVTDLRLWLREQGEETARAIRALQSALVGQAERHVETVLPGFTHLQPAQPVVLAHHLLAYFWMLERDHGRLRDALERMNLSPLGSGAMAGTGFPIDREFTAQELGFAAPTPNSMDAVADRDFVVEYMAFAALCVVHLSRLAQEITMWAAPQFGFVTLDDAYSTGSSIMPQKKNPDVAELTRGKTGRVIGHLTGTLAVLKGLPLTYNSDLQEDKEALFDTVDTLKLALHVFEGMVRTATFNRERMAAAAGRGFTTATDVADDLARRGVPFRQAHEIVGRMVAHCEQNNKALEDLTSGELREFWPDFPEEYRLNTPLESAASRNSYGGTAPERVREQLEAARRKL
ncbi:MAG: argininosuccinate lyase [Armatimonadetes bacterium]|nr:argininosuccinate lyase [Armatimonadota bacterium]